MIPKTWARDPPASASGSVETRGAPERYVSLGNSSPPWRVVSLSCQDHRLAKSKTALTGKLDDLAGNDRIHTAIVKLGQRVHFAGVRQLCLRIQIGAMAIFGKDDVASCFPDPLVETLK